MSQSTAMVMGGRSVHLTHFFLGKFEQAVKAAYSVTMNIFRKKYFLFKAFVKVELSNVFTIKMFSTAENCMEK